MTKRGRLSLIVRVNVVLNRTVVVASEDDYHTGNETSVTVNNNSSIQDYVDPDDQTQP